MRTAFVGLGECDPWGLCDLPEDLTTERGRQARYGLAQHMYGAWEQDVPWGMGSSHHGYTNPWGMSGNGSNTVFWVFAIIGGIWLYNNLVKPSQRIFW